MEKPLIIFECGFKKKRKDKTYFPYTKMIKSNDFNHISYLLNPFLPKEGNKIYVQTDRQRIKWYNKAVENQMKLPYNEFCEYYDLK